MTSVTNEQSQAAWIYSPVATHKDCVLIPVLPPYVPWNGGTGHGGSTIWKCPNPKQIKDKESEKEVPKPQNQTQQSWPHWRGHSLSSSSSSSR